MFDDESCSCNTWWNLHDISGIRMNFSFSEIIHWSMIINWILDVTQVSLSHGESGASVHHNWWRCWGGVEWWDGDVEMLHCIQWTLHARRSVFPQLKHQHRQTKKFEILLGDAGGLGSLHQPLDDHAGVLEALLRAEQHWRLSCFSPALHETNHFLENLVIISIKSLNTNEIKI